MCPNCGSAIIANDHSVFCTDRDKCGFHMNGGKFKDIVLKLYKPSKVAPNGDNLSELNNLGHKKVSEDFSDSHALDY